jgi:hypothetical protein
MERSSFMANPPQFLQRANESKLMLSATGKLHHKCTLSKLKLAQRRP